MTEVEVIGVPEPRPKPVVSRLVSTFEVEIEAAQATLYEAAEQLARGKLLDAVADVESYFFVWDCDLAKAANALLDALPDDEEEAA